MAIGKGFQNTVDKHWYVWACIKHSSEPSEICPSLEKFNKYYLLVEFSHWMQMIPKVYIQNVSCLPLLDSW